MSEEKIDPALQKIKDGTVEYLSNKGLMPKKGDFATLFVFIGAGFVEISIRAEAEKIKL